MEKMTVEQLKEVAKQKKIQLPAKAKKAEIIALISGAQKEKPAPKSKEGVAFPGEY